MVEVGGRHSRGKELASYYLDRTRLKKLRDWHNNKPGSVPAVDAKQLAYRNYRSRYVPGAEPDTPVTSFRAVLREQTPPPTDVHVLILTWAKHDRRGEDGQLLSPGLDIETDTARACFKRRGYKVQCRVIPEDYPTSAVETVLGRFLNQSAPGTLLMVYYRGHGNMEGDRMVFSRFVFFAFRLLITLITQGIKMLITDVIDPAVLEAAISTGTTSATPSCKHRATSSWCWTAPPRQGPRPRRSAWTGAPPRRRRRSSCWACARRTLSARAA